MWWYLASVAAGIALGVAGVWLCFIVAPRFD